METNRVYVGDHLLGSYTRDKWHKLRLLADKTTGKFSVWIDDVLKGENLTASGDLYEIQAFGINQGSSEGDPDKTYFDEVKIFGLVPDVAITKVALSSTVVGQGRIVPIHVTVANQGDHTERFNVTAYYNGTNPIATKTITLTSGNSTTIIFTWNTTVVPYGNYTINAYAHPVPGETDIDDNTYTKGTIMITILGDINGDRVVDSTDQGILGMAWGSIIGEPNYIPEADLNGDGVVDSTDLGIVGVNWGRTWP